MLKRKLLIIILVAIGLCLVLTRSDFISDSRSVLSKVITANQIKEEDVNITQIIEGTNKERIAEGITPLSTNTKLNQSAEIKVDDMIARQYFEHQSPTGEGVSDLGKKVGYEYVIMGENLALGMFSSSEEIVKAWMASPGHRENILNTKYKEIGVSVKRGLYEGKEVWFAVQHFGTSRSSCPSISETLKEYIDTINTELKREERDISLLKKSLEAPGASSDPNYQTNIQAFNKKVDEYNNKLALSRQKIELYNAQVKDFNKCIATFQ